MMRTYLASVGLLVACIVTCTVAGAEERSPVAEIGPPPEIVPLPRAAYSATNAPNISLGLSVGPIWPTDPTLDVGFYAVGQFAIWLTPHVALELDVGHTIFDDDFYGGELTVNPIAGYIVLSLPLAPGYAEAAPLNFRFAAGFGRLSITHTLTGVEDESFFALQAGIEWAMPSRGRLFIVADTMWADFVVGDRLIFDPGIGGLAIPFWDLNVLTTLRFGIEFPF